MSKLIITSIALILILVVIWAVYQIKKDSEGVQIYYDRLNKTLYLRSEIWDGEEE